ncbi:MAG TPA: hypothetical protein VFU21_28970, partial [Kofleriaceae bacterium]|nr:hypothetical protein [Kofleriaceae bacterium]
RESKKPKKHVAVDPEPPPPRVVVDAAPVVEKRPEAPAADAVLTVAMDTWCDLAIDGVPVGRITKTKTAAVRPGRHDLACKNDALGTWKESVELAAGEKKTVRGTLVPEIAVRVKVSQGNEVLIDKQKVGNGATRPLKRGSHRIEVLRMGKVVDSAWLTITRPCTLVDRPAIACR